MALTRWWPEAAMLPPEVAGEGNPPDGDMVLLDDEGLTNKNKKAE